MTVRFTKQDSRYPDLTAGNLYRVIGIEADDYRIMNDDGRPYLYPPELFTVVDPRQPDDWQMTTGDEGERYAYPPQLGRPGFFEDYFDNDRRTMATLHAYLAESRSAA